jgi:oxygen-independent coproporphyrinogen-3 oxidase
VQTVFIGGGTPSLFSPEGIARLLSDLRSLLPLAPGCEITLEANPGTFERERFKAFRAAGVTRLSIGVQSFDDAKLKALGRVHDRAQALAAIGEAAASFDTFNLDLMYALPGQTAGRARNRPAHRAGLQPAAPEPVSPDTGAEHGVRAEAAGVARRGHECADDGPSGRSHGPSGLERYEVSAFARPGHRCAHNLNYWQFGDYLAWAPARTAS